WSEPGRNSVTTLRATGVQARDTAAGEVCRVDVTTTVEEPRLTTVNGVPLSTRQASVVLYDQATLFSNCVSPTLSEQGACVKTLVVGGCRDARPDTHFRRRLTYLSQELLDSPHSGVGVGRDVDFPGNPLNRVGKVIERP